MSSTRSALFALLSTVAGLGAFAFATPRVALGEGTEKTIDVQSFRIIPRESGPDNYYNVVLTPERFIHSAYRPPMKTAVMGYEVPESQRRSIAEVRWRWRANELPKGGDECTKGRGDSVAVVYVTWRRGLRWYTLKYVWSAVSPKGTTCDRKRSVFSAQDTVIIESGPPLGEWRGLKIDLDTEYRNHFEDGNQSASVPDFIGLGIMSDGDQTGTPSSADFADFALVSK